MHNSPNLTDLIQQRLDEILAAHRSHLSEIGDDFAPLLDEAEAFLRGGKRLRARFLVLAYEAIRPLDFSGKQLAEEPRRVVDAACALELFHAAALVHDDIIDRSDTRRNRPAAHTLFSTIHEQERFRGDSEHFGVSAALLLGDLLQTWADIAMQGALDALPSRQAAGQAREFFNRMRSEVAIGQFLDVLEEQRTHFADHEQQLERSTRVLVYKSAKYSIQAPIQIGAAMADAGEEQLRALTNFGLPAGVAFQLRDDLLGVFGNEALTGKPTGGDLTEGKRTLLVTLARNVLPLGQRNLFDELIGDPDLDTEQIRLLQETIQNTGARERVEEMISSNVGIAREALGDADLVSTATRALLQLAEYAAHRES